MSSRSPSSSSFDENSCNTASTGRTSHDTPHVMNKTGASSSLPTNPHALPQRRWYPQRHSLPIPNHLVEDRPQQHGHPFMIESSSRPRFRSLSDYSSFQPQALDCFTSHSTCIGAMASTHSGIILVPLATLPYQPLLILRHVIPFSHPHTISCLKFQPSSSPRWLSSASSHSPSILIWDISGHAMNPLLTRLNTNHDYSMSLRSSIHEHPCITSMAWKQVPEGHETILFAAGLGSISMWDLRAWNHSNTCSSSSRPHQQWGNDCWTFHDSVPSHRRPTFVSVSTCNNAFDPHTIATLDSSGIVRFFDDRISRSSVESGGIHTGSAIDSFVAHTMAGVGLDCFPSSKRNSWITWGVEENGKPAVKIWKPKEGPSDAILMESTRSGNTSFHCTTHIMQKFLSCARVCPQTYGNPTDTILTIQTGNPLQGEGWTASVWSIQDVPLGNDLTPNEPILGAQHVTTFSGLKDDFIPLGIQDESITWKQDPLIAAELTCTRNMTGDDQSSESLLCCLSSKGYLSTFAIPEMASTKIESHHSVSVSVAQPRPSDVCNVVKNDKIEESMEHVFLTHLQHMWTTHEDDSIMESSPLYMDGYSNQDSMWLDDDGQRGTSAPNFSIGESLNAVPYHVDGVSLHVDFGRDTVSQVEDPYESDTIPIFPSSVQDSTPIKIDPYQALRVPSPRLCGASFCMDKLTVFTNGSLMKTWSWFISDQNTENKSFQTRVDQLDEYPDFNTNPLVHKNPSEMTNLVELITVKSLESPHTFLDFCRMMDAVNMARLGNVENDPGDDNVWTEQNNSELEDDDASSDTDTSDDSNLLSNISADEKDTMYTNYFGHGSMGPFESNMMSPRTSFKQMQPRVEQSNDHSEKKSNVAITLNFLTPSVFVVDEPVALSHQSIRLAEQWLLGSWEESSDGVDSVSENQVHDKRSISSHYFQRDENIDPYHSFQNISPRNELMIGNLCHVIYNNQKGGSIVGVPLDQRVMQKGKKARDDSVQSPTVNDKERMDTTAPFFVQIKPRGNAHRHLIKVRDICTHNSEISRLLGFSQKADIWQLLSLIVDNVLNGAYDDFDGWNGLGGAIGNGLLLDILLFYEKLGDIQMLATIICVFCGGRDRKRRTYDSMLLTSFHLLRPNDDAKFDNYILLYGSILYRWGLLNTQTELNKHLASTTLCANLQDGVHTVVPHHGSLKFIPVCHRCLSPVDTGTDVCNKCKGFAFICSICVLPVRGAFLICQNCGHGGHVQHLMSWFHECKTCPTGCGCSCVYESACGI